MAEARSPASGPGPEPSTPGSPLSGPGWEASAHFRPAREVGGDFYDFIDMGEGKLGLVIGDVTGKSVSGALVMTASKSVFRLLSEEQMSVGEIMKRAIHHNAAAIVVAHNHPSGDPTPSPEDVAVTRQLVASGKMLDIDVLDHLVIGRGAEVSFAERGFIR